MMDGTAMCFAEKSVVLAQGFRAYLPSPASSSGRGSVLPPAVAEDRNREKDNHHHGDDDGDEREDRARQLAVRRERLVNVLGAGGGVLGALLDGITECLVHALGPVGALRGVRWALELHSTKHGVSIHLDALQNVKSESCLF